MHAFCCIFACALYLHVHWYLINIVYFLPPCILHLWATRGIMFSTCPSVRACACTSVSAGVVSGLLSNSSLMGIQMTIPLLIFIKLSQKTRPSIFNGFPQLDWSLNVLLKLQSFDLLVVNVHAECYVYMVVGGTSIGEPCNGASPFPQKSVC